MAASDESRSAVTGVSERVALNTLRALLERASAPTEATTLARMEAVVALDFVCEAVVRMALRARAQPEKEREYFPDLLTRLEKHAGQDVIHGGADARSVHRTRNRALHELRGPDESYVADIAPGIRAFVSSVVAFGWSVDFELISLGDGIQDERLRELIQKAEQSLRDGDTRDATIALAIARGEFESRLSKARSPRSWRGTWAYRLSRGVDSTIGALIRGLTRGVGTFESRDLQHDFEELGTALDTALADVDALALGLATKEVRWLRQIVPSTVFFEGGSIGVFLPKTLPSAPDLRRALRFLVAWIEAAEPLPSGRAHVATDRGDDPMLQMVRLASGWPSTESQKT